MKYILITFLAVVLYACSSNNIQYVVIFEHGNGIKTGMPVLVDKDTVGQVVSIKLDDKLRTSVTVDIDSKMHIPVDSKFRTTILKFNSNAIIIELGTTKKYLNSQDTINGTLHY